MVGENLKRLRKEKGISLRQMEEEIGIKRGQLSDWENGKYEPNAKNIKKLAKYFGISMEEMLGPE